MLGGWGGNRGPGGKSSSLYRQVYGFSHLPADCRGPGSAPEPYARFKYRTFTFKPNLTSTLILTLTIILSLTLIPIPSQTDPHYNGLSLWRAITF